MSTWQDRPPLFTRLLDACLTRASVPDLTPSRDDHHGLDLAGAMRALHEDFVDPAGPRLSALGTRICQNTLAHGAALRTGLRAVSAVWPESLRPVVIVGLHRTGTTFLQHVLAALPGWRAPTFSELLNPCGGPAPQLRALLSLSLSRALTPEMRHVHPVAVAAPEECWPIFLATAAVRHWDLHLRVPRYRAWLDAADLRPAYRLYRIALAAIVSRWSQPPRLIVLKCPEHLWSLDALAAELPDATIIWCHRDPVPAVTSYASLSALQHRTMYGRYHPAEVGAHVSESLARGIERALASRVTLPLRILDVAYERFVADPAGTVQALVRVIDPTAVAQVPRALRAAQRTSKPSNRRFTPEDFGLETARLTERFAVYCELLRRVSEQGRVDTSA